MIWRFARLLTVVLPAMALGVAPAAAAVSRLGTDFALNPEVSCAATDPQLAALANGDLVAVWRTEQGVWARRFDARGVPRFPYATQVASGYSMAFPRVAPLADGGFAIAWFDQARRQIVVRRADADGHLGAPADVLPSALPDFDGELSGLALGAGVGDRLGVAYTVAVGATFFREMGTDGTPTSPLIPVGSDALILGDDFYNYSPVLLPAQDGSYAVFWISWQRGIHGTAAQQGRIDSRRLRPPFAGELEDAFTVPGYPVATSLSGAVAPDGSYLLAWTTPTDFPLPMAAVQTQRVSIADEALGVRATLTSGEPFVGAVTAAASPQGGFAVAWEGPAAPPLGTLQIYLRLVNDDGAPTGAVEPVASPDALDSAIAPSLTFLAGGQLVAAWDGGSCSLCDPPLCFAGRLRAQRFAVGCGTPGSGVLCLGGGRFEATLAYSDPRRGLAGTGVAVPLTADSGYFWFFAASNLEVLVKVLDGRAFNGHYWVFWGGVTDVGFHLTVHDTVTGAARTYDSPAGTFASAADTSALPAAGVAAALGDDMELRELSSAGLDRLAFAAPPVAGDLEPAIAPMATATAPGPQGETGGVSPCTPASLPVVPRPGLCLAGHRFEVEATWDDIARQGVAQPLPLSDDTGLFWFFAPSNAELVVKVLDGRAVNGRFWVFYGALTNVAYDLVVRHVEDGTEWRRHSAGGSFGSGADTAALQPPSCECPTIFVPVCGRDGKLYANACAAYCVGWVSVDSTSTAPLCAGN
ncbi:MAG TPA: Kazal-type serine protease inhibitor [Thermoanaerobaculia bacterium]|nr:Kazal-type serine protease inhibitor [Thermoanaerobaculia bacterium]